MLCLPCISTKTACCILCAYRRVIRGDARSRRYRYTIIPGNKFTALLRVSLIDLACYSLSICYIEWLKSQLTMNLAVIKSFQRSHGSPLFHVPFSLLPMDIYQQ